MDCGLHPMAVPSPPPSDGRGESQVEIFPEDLRIEPLNYCRRPSFQTIGGQFSLSPRERAGVRESLSDGNVLPVHGRVTVPGVFS